MSAINNGHKGQIMTILKDVKINDINWALICYESFNFNDYQKFILPYVISRTHSSSTADNSDTSSDETCAKCKPDFVSARAYGIRPVLVRLSNALINATKSMYKMFEELNTSCNFDFAPQQSIMSELMAALSEASLHLPDGLFNSILQYAFHRMLTRHSKHPMKCIL